MGFRWSPVQIGPARPAKPIIGPLSYYSLVAQLPSFVRTRSYAFRCSNSYRLSPRHFGALPLRLEYFFGPIAIILQRRTTPTASFFRYRAPNERRRSYQRDETFNQAHYHCWVDDSRASIYAGRA